MNASKADQARTKPVAFRTKYPAASPMVRLLSARHEGVRAHTPPGIDLDHAALQSPRLIRATRVDGQRPAEPGDALGFVDVAVQGEDWLIPHNRIAHGRRPYRLQQLAGMAGAQLAVERGGLIQLRSVRRTGQVENGPSGIVHTVGHVSNAMGELLL